MSLAPSLIIQARPKDLGGFSVARVLPYKKRRMVGPFIFADHLGPTVMEPDARVDVRPHPHIHLATVTYLFEGEMDHRDSLGSVQRIHPGAINLMTAGRGIAHSERTPAHLTDQSFPMHGMQIWIALPDGQEKIEPAFDHYPADDLPVRESEGVQRSTLMGTFWNMVSPVKTYSPTLYASLSTEQLHTETLHDLPEELGIYVVTGAIIYEDVEYAAGQMLVFDPQPTDTLTLHLAPGTKVMLLGGDAIGERHIWWNFVSSDKADIEQAKLDWREGNFAQVPEETERTPLPEDWQAV